MHENMILMQGFVMKTHSSDTFESLYILLGLGVLHPTEGIYRKEKELMKNDVIYTKNNQFMPSFLLISQF